MQSYYSRDDTNSNRTALLCGAPGIGKTETARRFAWQNKELFHGNIIWILSETYQNIQQSFKNLAIRLDLHFSSNSISNQEYSWPIYEEFQSSACLVIFDNAENMESIKEFLPSRNMHKTVNVLITSQYIDWDTSSVYKVQLKALAIEESVFIMKHDIPEEKINLYSNEMWEDLVVYLECIPLSIQIVSALIKEELNKLRLRDTFDLKKFIEDLKAETYQFETKRFPDSVVMHYNKTVIASIGYALQRLEQKEANRSLDLLYFMAYLDADLIYDELLLLVPSIKESITCLEEALHLLIKFSLISEERSSMNLFFPSSIRIKIHRTVQLVLRHFDLCKQNGTMYKNVLNAIIANQNLQLHHSKSILKYAEKEEFKKICCEFYKSSKDSADSFLIYLAYTHCHFILKEILEKCYKKPYIFTSEYYNKLNIMLLMALENVNSDSATVDLLFDYGAKIIFDSHSKYLQENVLHFVANWTSIDIFERVLNSNIVDSTNNDGETVLHVLVNNYRENNSEKTLHCIKYLVSNWKANTSIRDKNGNTVLHTACKLNKPSVPLIKFLLEKHVCNLNNLKTENSEKFVNFKDINGNIALNYLILNIRMTEEEKVEVIKLFVEANVDLEIRNNIGETPSIIAEKNKLSKIAQILK